jgi:Zn-dependent protease with chaperone function
MSDNILVRIPTREALLERFAHARRLDTAWLMAQVGGLVVLAFLVDWNDAATRPIISLVAAMSVVGPIMTSVAIAWAQNKREIGQLKEQTRFGEFDKHRLRSLLIDTLSRLRMQEVQVPVYITPNRMLNAGSVNLGFTGYLLGMNGVYLNRQVLHKLSPAEVQNIMGQELGHYRMYRLPSERFLELTFGVGALFGIFVSQLINMPGFFGILLQVVLASAFWWIASFPRAMVGSVVELLCDDLGAQVQGVEASVSSFLKIGLESELLYTVHLQALLANKENHSLSVAKIAETVEAAVPYGHFTHEELERAVNEALQNRKRKEEKISLLGFLDYIWNSDQDDDDESIAEIEAQVKALQQWPRLEWEDLLETPQGINLNATNMEALVNLIAENPDHVLFQLPEEIGKGDSVHPPIRIRILYLWKNRLAIAAQRRALEPMRQK